MLIWTAAAIGILGFLVGELLLAAATGSGFFLGFSVSHSSALVAQLSGHVIVGLGVLVRVLHRYLEVPAPTG